MSCHLRPCFSTLLTALLTAMVSCTGLARAADAAPVAPSSPEDAALEALVTAMARVGNASSPQYSPDGTKIAFHTSLSGVSQVWWIPAEGGYPRMVTAGPDAAQGVTWSPDGRLAYGVAPGGGFNVALKLTTLDGTDTVTMDDDGDANTFTGDFAKDGRYYFTSNVRDPETTDAWIWDPATGRSQLAFKGQGGLSRIADLRGESAIECSLVTRGDLTCYRRDLRSGERLLLTPHEGMATAFADFGHDTDTMYVAHNIDRDRMEFARITVDADGKPSPPKAVARRDDAEIESFLLSKDYSTAVLLWNVAGKHEIERVDLGRDRDRRRPLPNPPAEIINSMDIAPNGRDLVVSVGGSLAPADLYVLDMDTGKWRQLTWSPHPGVDLSKLVKPSLRTFKAHDGLELSGWLYLPEDFRAPGPVVLSFHGGPEGQALPTFRGDYQALLASGIAVFAPNIRGSSGFGKRFIAMDNQAGRFDANKDIKAAADFLVGEGIGARGRLGITGGSYGGYATMVGVTEFPDTFAAGANLFGIVNFETFFKQSTPWMGAISTSEYGDPKTQAKMLRDLSPIHKLDRITAAMLVMHGANDTNVPVVEATQVVDSLKARDVDVQYVLFPDEGHGWRKEPNRVRSTLELVRFFRRELSEPAADREASRE